jgi:hypothetical protein
MAETRKEREIKHSPHKLLHDEICKQIIGLCALEIRKPTNSQQGSSRNNSFLFPSPHYSFLIVEIQMGIETHAKKKCQSKITNHSLFYTEAIQQAARADQSLFLISLLSWAAIFARVTIGYPFYA